jgi:hypothetical protein
LLSHSCFPSFRKRFQLLSESLDSFPYRFQLQSDLLFRRHPFNQVVVLITAGAKECIWVVPRSRFACRASDYVVNLMGALSTVRVIAILVGR